MLRPGHVTLLLVAFAFVVVGLRWGVGDGPLDDALDAAQRRGQIAITNRVWRDRRPKDARDLTFHLLLVDRAKVRTGALAFVSQWKFMVERVRFSIKGNTLMIESPQDNVRSKIKYRTWACGREAPKGFDLCLELTHKGRKIRLYSARSAPFGEEASPLEVPVLFSPDEVAACEHCVDGEAGWLARLFAR